MRVSAVKNIYAFSDGDNITPGMGVIIDAGYGLQQYYNPSTKEVVETDFTKHPAVLYPQAYSSKQGAIIVPETVGQQWYYNNISTEGAILEDGEVKAKYTSLFELTTVTNNGKTFPALRIKGNLVTETDWTDKYIYYSSSYKGNTFTCQQMIPIKATVGDTYDILLSYVGADGTGDNVLSTDNDYVEVTANLQASGKTISDVTYKFQHLVNNVFVDVATLADVMEVNGNTAKFYENAVDGVEVFRVVATYKDEEYVKAFEITDVHDPYILDDGCSHPSGGVQAGEKVTFSPKVYERSTWSLSTGWSFSYIFMSEGVVINDVTASTLTYENISKYKGITVRIEASKS